MLSLWRAWVQSLVGEFSSRKPMAGPERKKKKIFPRSSLPAPVLKCSDSMQGFSNGSVHMKLLEGLVENADSDSAGKWGGAEIPVMQAKLV